MKEGETCDSFRRMRKIHKNGRRNEELEPVKCEAFMDASWTVAIKDCVSKMIWKTEEDFQDCLFVSMGVSVRIEKPACHGENVLQHSPHAEGKLPRRIFRRSASPLLFV